MFQVPKGLRCYPLITEAWLGGGGWAYFSDTVYISNRYLSLARSCDAAVLKAVPGILDLVSLVQTRIQKVGSAA